MTIETLWITLPTDEENKIKEILNSIKNKNLANISINQLIEKLENAQGTGWIEVLGEYNAISSVNNIDTSEMLSRAKSVSDKFELRGYPQLKDREFEPSELLSLVILCYSNPVLIGPKLCKALNGNNRTNIKKEMLENSAYRRSENRVLPSQSNLRLMGAAIYFNDTSIMLPVNVINRVTEETIRDGRIVRKLDQRGGFEEIVNGPERAACEANERGARMKRDQSKIDSYTVLQSLQAYEGDLVAERSENLDQYTIPPFPPEVHQLDNGSMVIPAEALQLDETNNATSSSYASGWVVGGLAFFHIVQNTPVAAVVRNIGKDLVTASKHVGSFFSKNTECAAQEQKTVLLSPTVKS